MAENFSNLFGGGGSSATLWTSGMTVERYEYVISPLDGELYQRLTATGAGTTDPADDTSNYSAKSYRRITAIAPSLSAAGAPGWTVSTTASRVASVSSPAMSAGVRTSVLSMTGKGSLDFLALRINTAGNPGDTRVEILIDGRTVFDKTLTTFSVSKGVFWLLSGSLVPTATSGDFFPVPSRVDFKRSLEVFFTSANNVGVDTRQLWSSYQGEA